MIVIKEIIEETVSCNFKVWYIVRSGWT